MKNINEIITHNYEMLCDDGSWMRLEQAWSYGKHTVGETIHRCRTFNDLWELTDTFEGIHKDETFFKHRPQVRIYHGFNCDYINEKNFRKCLPLTFREVRKIFKPSMKWLAEHLNAEQFVKYCGDRDWEVTIHTP